MTAGSCPNTYATTATTVMRTMFSIAIPSTPSATVSSRDRSLREELTEGGEERQDEERDRRRRDNRPDRTSGSSEACARTEGRGHPRLRFHQRAASGSAGAKSSSPATLSGTTVAIVSLE